MTKSELINHINGQKSLAVRNLKKSGWRTVRIIKIEDGLILRDKSHIYCYYNETTNVWIQFEPTDEDITIYKDEFMNKIMSSQHPIDVQIYTFNFPYPLRDNKAHVWLNYNATQWDEITNSDFAPLLYDLDGIGTRLYPKVSPACTAVHS